MTQRHAWLVGAMAAASSEAAMRIALEAVGPFLKALPDGETSRLMWVGDWRSGLGRLPWIRTHNPLATYRTLEDVQHYEIMAGHEVTAGELHACIPLKEAVTVSYPRFLMLREEAGLPQLDFQVTGIPTPVDWALAAFAGPGLEEPLIGAMTTATADVITAIAEMTGPDVIFQLEMPMPVAWVMGAPAAAQEKAAQAMAGLITRLPLLTPAGTRYALHACFGDFGHRKNGYPETAGPVVTLVNAVIAAWPAGRPLQEVHVPCAGAADPPSPDPAWYAPLSELQVPAGAGLAAGFVHEALNLEQHQGLLRVIEQAAEQQVDVATTCGLGRRPDPAQVPDALGKLSALAAA